MGSEMCIRDSVEAAHEEITKGIARFEASCKRRDADIVEGCDPPSRRWDDHAA